MSAIRWLFSGLLSLALLCAAKPLHPYRTTDSITQVLAAGPHAGDCDQCHTVHGQGEIVYGHALIGPDENSLCDRCHTTPWSGGSYAGTSAYTGSAHAAGSGTIWPGPEPPPRTEAGAAGKCLNCHDPHGWGDPAGLIPMLAIGREETLCLSCHDGAPAATNITVELMKPYRHPVLLHSGRHHGPLESQPTDFATVPQDNRHAECADCHNPHVGTADPGGPPPAPGMSRSLLGVSRLLVQNGAAGATPVFTFVAGSDTSAVPRAEYQLCFKCHSTWTTPPTGQVDLPVELNPANASFHPVEATGRDLMIPGGAFTMGWSASAMTSCGDCHGSDFTGGTRGPHGSTYRYILKRPYDASSQPRTMSSDEMCFSCHAYDVYANPGAPDPVKAYSRFNAPAATGHTQHVGQFAVPCYACHVTHGAPMRAHLMVTGRMPGLADFTETATGGTCTPTCHAPQSYSINYGR